MPSIGMGRVPLLMTGVTAVGIAQSHRCRVRFRSPADKALRIVLDDIGVGHLSASSAPSAACMPDWTQMISGCARS
jgi:hypothetical protein